MVQSLASTTLGMHPSTPKTLFNILRTETVLSRFPIHNLSTGNAVSIHITQTNAQGVVDLRWAVSYNEFYGPPRHLAYKLDTIVINQILDTLSRPLPRVLRLGSLRYIGTLLDLQVSGRQYAHLKSAFHQNASAYVVAYLRYRGRDGVERTVNTGFTRYSVIFTGETLPDGTEADAVYLVLSDPYLDILNHAPVRPLDYTYLKSLTPTAQRFYEILSYKMFAALKHRHAYATLRYGEYCLLSTQKRYLVYDQVKKQMYKVHQPHVTSGYFAKVRYEAVTDDDGQPDWLMHYTPGPKAHTEYAAFMRQPHVTATSLDDLASTALPEPMETPVLSIDVSGEPSSSPPDALHRQAEALIQQFYQHFHGLNTVQPTAKELAQARQLLIDHGQTKAETLLAYSYRMAPTTHYHPQTFGGILPYLPRVLANAETHPASPPTPTHVSRAEQLWHERYIQWRQDTLTQLREKVSPLELRAMEDTVCTRLRNEGTPAFALGLAMRVAVDEMLEAQANLPAFAEWKDQQNLMDA